MKKKMTKTMDIADIEWAVRDSDDEDFEKDIGACNEKQNQHNQPIEDENHDRGRLSHCENDCVNDVRLENEAGW